jgi:hypothetical protein
LTCGKNLRPKKNTPATIANVIKNLEKVVSLAII